MDREEVKDLTAEDLKKLMEKALYDIEELEEDFFNLQDYLLEDYSTGDNLIGLIHPKFMEDYIRPYKLKIRIAESYGGEGKGDEYWNVIKIFKHNLSNTVAIYLKFEGVWNSYTEATYCNWSFVQPVIMVKRGWIRNQ